jgi:Fe2+ or Zn2+ uptake regulation protein
MHALKYTNETFGWTADYIPTSGTYRISSGSSHLGHLTPHAISTMPDWKPVKSVLFVSEEGKDVFDGEVYFIVEPDFTIVKATANYGNLYTGGVLRFSDEGKAKSYVVTHKTVFSLEDIIYMTASQAVVDAAEKVARSRIFNEEPTVAEVAHVPPIVIYEFVAPTEERLKAIERIQEESTKPTIHQKLEELKTSNEVVTTSTMGQKILAILGTSEMDFEKLKRSLISKHQKEKVSDIEVYKALDELESAHIISKTKSGRDSKFVYSL